MLDTIARSAEAVSTEHASGPVEASLHFRHGGGRTVLTRQHVPYPFHATRPFYLDRKRPEIATLYLQSASGGLYRGDDVALSIVAGPHAAVHVTTQASTIVHKTHKRAVAQTTRIEIGEHSFVAMTPDPLVLFPGAEICCTTEVTLAAAGCAILTDGLAHHDPEGTGRPFERYSNAIIVRDKSGARPSRRPRIAGRRSDAWTSLSARTFLRRGDAAGSRTRSRSAVMQTFWKAASPISAAWPAYRSCRTMPASAAAYWPHNGGALARGLEAAFAIAFEALIGVPPARRRK